MSDSLLDSDELENYQETAQRYMISSRTSLRLLAMLHSHRYMFDSLLRMLSSQLHPRDITAALCVSHTGHLPS